MVPDRVRLPLTFDPAALAADLAALANTPWTRHVVRDNYEGDWEIIPLRSAAGEKHPIRLAYPDPGATHFVDTAFMAACPYIRDQVMPALHCTTRSTRLMRLTPGSKIKEHADPALSVEDGAARLHIPITTNPDVDFQLNRVRVDMAPGSVWYLRLTNPHRAANRGATDRVHLVVDVEVNDWVRGMLGTRSVRDI